MFLSAVFMEWVSVTSCVVKAAYEPAFYFADRPTFAVVKGTDSSGVWL